MTEDAIRYMEQKDEMFVLMNRQKELDKVAEEVAKKVSVEVKDEASRAIKDISEAFTW